MTDTVAPVLALDSASLYYRSYYALPSSMTAPDGHPHNAIRGFLTTITRLVETYRPRAVVAAWDADWRPDWRVELIASYKTHRLADGEQTREVAEEEPEDLSPQVEAIADLLDALGLPRWGAAGYEADDVLGTIAAGPEHTIVVSGDRDLVQLIDRSTRLLLTVNGGMEKWPLLDAHAARERFGVDPSVYADMAALRGDPSDGLPGVAGIGPKTAVSLITAFGDLAGVVTAAEAGTPARPMTARIATKVTDSADYLHRALQVTRVARDVPLPADLNPLPNEVADPEALDELSARWGVERQVGDLRRALAAGQAR